MDIRKYAEIFEANEREFEASIEEFGVLFEREESSPRLRREQVGRTCACHCENGGSSVWRGWISTACRACRTGEQTASLFVDLRCTKDCYFCFNCNQPHYEHFRVHKRNISLELDQAHAAGAKLRCLAVTGGEPLLNKDQVLPFLAHAKKLYPATHLRLYTNGDLLDEETLEELASSGLDEIRFSVKPLDFDDNQEHVFAMMERAATVLPDVVVEVPVIPDSVDELESLMRRANSIGVRGINLLEFCFPLHKTEEFLRRGFELRKHPYKYPYQYRYSGGIPIARSEKEALRLMEFAVAENLRMGVHYCSADNRISAQVNLQNKMFSHDGRLRRQWPWMDADEDDHFLRCAKAFGGGAADVREWAERAGSIPYSYDADVPSIAIPRSLASDAMKACPKASFGESVSVLEREGDIICTREITVRELA